MDIVCTPRSRCNRWRVCARCARIRQAKIADTVEARMARDHYLSYVVLKTNSPLTLEADKRRLMRSVRDISSGGVWTVEVGDEFRGLHVNLIIASQWPLKVSRIRKVWGDLGDVYCEPVLGWREYWEEVEDQLGPRGRSVYKDQLDDLYTGWTGTAGQAPGLESYKKASTSARSLAAYCAKQEAMPRPEEYGGRLYGSWGSCNGAAPKSAGAVMTDKGMRERNPTVATVAMLADLEDGGAADSREVSSAAELMESARAALVNPETGDFVKAEGWRVMHRAELPQEAGKEKPQQQPERQPLRPRPQSPPAQIRRTGREALAALKASFTE